jgi:hypothetical protein
MVVTKKELDHYLSKLQRNNEIARFWGKILKKLPKELLDEIRQKPTNLVFVNKGEFELIGHKPYIFITVNGSKELNAYLKEFVIYVSEDTQEAYKSEIDVNLKLQSKTALGR